MQILNITHIQIALNRALYNHNTLKKFKSESIKKEICYYTCERNKIDQCFELHKISDASNEVYFIFIDMEKNKVNIAIQ
jgi:Kinase binding protein CGI-121